MSTMFVFCKHWAVAWAASASGSVATLLACGLGLMVNGFFGFNLAEHPIQYRLTIPPLSLPGCPLTLIVVWFWTVRASCGP